MERFDWMVFGQDFTVWTITLEMVRLRIFFSLSREIQVEQNTKRFLKAEFKFCPHNSTIIAGGV